MIACEKCGKTAFERPLSLHNGHMFCDWCISEMHELEHDREVRRRAAGIRRIRTERSIGQLFRTIVALPIILPWSVCLLLRNLFAIAEDRFARLMGKISGDDVNGR